MFGAPGEGAGENFGIGYWAGLALPWWALM